MAIFEIFEGMKAKMSRLTITPMKDDGEKWHSANFENSAHFKMLKTCRKLLHANFGEGKQQA